MRNRPVTVVWKNIITILWKEKESEVVDREGVGSQIVQGLPCLKRVPTSFGFVRHNIMVLWLLTVCKRTKDNGRLLALSSSMHQ